MMGKEEISFEIKKKRYKTPDLKKYGSYHEYTKGSFNGTGQADGQQYYGSDLHS